MPQNYSFPINSVTFRSKIFTFRIRLSLFNSILTGTAPLSHKIAHRTELGISFVARKLTVQKWDIRMSQNSASIRNEAQKSPKIPSQLHTLPFRKRIWGLNRKLGAGMSQSNAKIAYDVSSVCDFMLIYRKWDSINRFSHIASHNSGSNCCLRTFIPYHSKLSDISNSSFVTRCVVCIGIVI